MSPQRWWEKRHLLHIEKQAKKENRLGLDVGKRNVGLPGHLVGERQCAA